MSKMHRWFNLARWLNPGEAAFWRYGAQLFPGDISAAGTSGGIEVGGHVLAAQTKTFGPTGGIEIGGHAAALQVSAAVTQIAAGRKRRPFRIPKARPIITMFGPSPIRLVVSGHAEARTVHAVSPRAVGLWFSGRTLASIRRLYELANGGPTLAVGGSGNPHARRVAGTSGGVLAGGHTEAYEAQDWMRAAIAREDEELLLELTGVL